MNNDIAVKEPTTTIQLADNERLTKYHTHVLPRLKDMLGWLKQGMNEYSIAEKLGIDRTTLIIYKEW